jgi:hypothetical protein
MDTIFKRLSEQSTWRGIILLLTAFGIQMEPDIQGHIMALGLSLVGLINVFRREKK